MTSDSDTNQITFWQFIGLASLLVAVFGSYFSEKYKIIVFLPLFACILIYVSYNIYTKNKPTFEKLKSIHKDEKNLSVILLIPYIIEFVHIIFLGLVIYSLFEKIILFPKNDISIIIALVFVSFELIFHSKNKNYAVEEPYKYDLTMFISCTLPLCLILISPVFFNSNSVVLHILSYLYVFHEILFLLFLAEIIKITLKIAYNFDTGKGLNLKKRSFLNIKTTLMKTSALFFVMLVLLLLIFVPQLDLPDKKQSNGCLSTKTYDLTKQQLSFGVYRKSVNMNNVSKVDLLFNGILKKDGPFVTLNLLNDSLDKSYIQYFDVGFIRDQRLDLFVYMFRNKGVEHLDSLELRIVEKTC